jgi:phospholipid transport system substrate-binding protein
MGRLAAMSVRRLILLLPVLVLVGLMPGHARAAAAGDAAAFIDNLVQQGLQTLRQEGITEEQREQRFTAMLHEDFDVPRIARYVLGRYWTSASEADRNEFGGLFERWVVRSYASRLGQYTSESVKVMGARAESDTGTVVSSQILHPNGPPTKVEWRVSTQGGKYKIIDIEVEGVSMALTEREEIAAVLQRAGGTVVALNKTLADKLRGDTATAAH